MERYGCTSITDLVRGEEAGKEGALVLFTIATLGDATTVVRRK